MNPIIMHINFCEVTFHTFGKTIDDVCRKAASWGFDGVEFRGRIPNDIKLELPEYMDEIAKGKAKYGLKEIMFGYNADGVSNPDAQVRAKAVENAIAFFKMAKEKCGTTVCNVFADPIVSKAPRATATNYNYHGSAVATQDEWDWTVDSFKKIGAELVKLGMRMGFETHMNYIHDTPQASKKLVDLIDCPAVGVNMDYGNSIYFTNVPDPVETVKLYGDKIMHMHLKNSTEMIPGVRIPTALSDGEINHRAYMQAVKDSGYTGPIGIEAPRGGDREWFAQQDLNYFKSLAKDIWQD